MYLHTLELMSDFTSLTICNCLREFTRRPHVYHECMTNLILLILFVQDRCSVMYLNMHAIVLCVKYNDLCCWYIALCVHFYQNQFIAEVYLVWLNKMANKRTIPTFIINVRATDKILLSTYKINCKFDVASVFYYWMTLVLFSEGFA